MKFKEKFHSWEYREEYSDYIITLMELTVNENNYSKSWWNSYNNSEDGDDIANYSDSDNDGGADGEGGDDDDGDNDNDHNNDNDNGDNPAISYPYYFHNGAYHKNDAKSNEKFKKKYYSSHSY